jgi:hypothetical protein
MSNRLKLMTLLFVAGCAGILFATPSCSKEVPFSCCTNPATCDEIRACDYWADEDPARTFCDVDGVTPEAAGRPRTCVRPPIPPGCDGPEDCSGATPFCRTSDRTCVECLDSTACPTAEEPVCASTTNVCSGCSADADCAGRGDGRSNCDTSTGVCRACVDDGDCSGMTPICDTSAKTCRACGQDNECAAGSGVCNTLDGDGSKGSCVAEGDVLYVNKDASALNLLCLKGAKCNSLSKAVTAAGTPASKFWVLMDAGSYTEDVVVAKKVVVKAVGNVTIEGTGVPMTTPTLTLNNGADIYFERVGLFGAGGTSTASVVDCVGSNGQSRILRGTGITISGGVNGGKGIDGNYCTMSLTGSTLSGNAGGGVVATNSTVTLTGSTLSGNAGGGIILTSSNFTVVNNFILGNGSVGSTTRGVRIATIAGTADPTLFAFNTLVDNLSNGSPRSLSCSDVDKDVTMDSNLIWGLVDEDEVTTAASEPQCTHNYSLIGPHAYVGGSNNVDITGVTKASLFVSIVDPTNFHLKAGSAAINKANTTVPPGVPGLDFDGDNRTQGGRADVGADEAQ